MTTHPLNVALVDLENFTRVPSGASGLRNFSVNTRWSIGACPFVVVSYFTLSHVSATGVRPCGRVHNRVQRSKGSVAWQRNPSRLLWEGIQPQKMVLGCSGFEYIG